MRPRAPRSALQGGDARQRFFAQDGRIAGDLGLARALEARHAPIERRNQVAQVVDQLRNGWRGHYHRRIRTVAAALARPGFQISPHASQRQYVELDSVLLVVATRLDAQKGHLWTAFGSPAGAVEGAGGGHMVLKDAARSFLGAPLMGLRPEAGLRKASCDYSSTLSRAPLCDLIQRLAHDVERIEPDPGAP